MSSICKELLRDALARVPVHRPPVEWCESTIRLPPSVTQRPGPLSLDLTPHIREPLRAACNSTAQSVTLCSATQMAKTTWLILSMAWHLAHRPAPTVIVMPNAKLAHYFSRHRWLSLLDESGLFLSEKKRNAIEHIINGGLVSFVGSNSPAQLASRPAGLMVLDEVDKFKRETDREADALALAENRTNAFAGAKILRASTPTVESGRIWASYISGSRERYLVKCPNCGERHELNFENVKWSPAAKTEAGWEYDVVRESARYHAPCCGAIWTDADRMRAVVDGEWVAEREDKTHRSFRVSRLASLLPSGQMGEIAVRFLRDKASGNLRDFVNSTLAEPWTVAPGEITENALDARRAEYQLGDLPSDVEPASVIIVAGIDVHLAHCAYVVRAFRTSDSASWLLDYGRLGDVESVGAVLQSRQWSGQRVRLALVDSGYATEQVYRACVRLNGRGFPIIPSKGTSAKMASGSFRFFELHFEGRVFRDSLVMYHDDDAKLALYHTAITDGVPAWYIPSGVGEDYVSELRREKMIEVPSKNGMTKIVWKRTGENHFGDCEKLALVASKIALSRAT